MRFRRFSLLLLAAMATLGSVPLSAAAQTPPAVRSPEPDDIVVTDIGISRRRVRVGDTIKVYMTLRNQGPLVIPSQPPSPSTVYTQGETYTQKGFPAQPGHARIVMSLSGPQGEEWPYRWGIGGSLPLGRVRSARYTIRMTTPGTYTLFVGVQVGGGPIRRIEAAHLTGIRVVEEGRSARGTGNVIPPTPPTRITVNGKTVGTDQRPILSNATMMVPLRFIMQEMGATVQWDPKTRRVTANRGTYNLSLTVGQKYNTANGKTVYVYVPPYIVNGRTMVPLRFITEGLGGRVYWNDVTKTVEITAPPLPA